MAIYESVIEAAQCDSRKTIEGQLSLFEQNDDIMRQCNPVEQLPQVENFSHELLIAMEKEMLGVYVTGHPLDAYEDRINEIQTVTSEELSHSEEGDMSKDGMNVTVAGIISGMRTLITKKNNIMAFVQIEDLYGEIELVVFPNVYERHRDLLEEDRIIVVKGVVNCKEEEAPKILADKIFPSKNMEWQEDKGRLRFAFPIQWMKKRRYMILKICYVIIPAIVRFWFWRCVGKVLQGGYEAVGRSF